MARVKEPDLDSVCNIRILFVINRNETGNCAFRIQPVIQRLHQGIACALRLPVLPLRFKFLNVGGIQQHDPAQSRSPACREDLPPESMLVDQGKQSGVIHMRMGEQHHVNLAGSHRKRFVLIQIRPLLHAAVDQKLLPAGFEIIAASGNFMGCANKCQLHIIYPFSGWKSQSIRITK